MPWSCVVCGKSGDREPVPGAPVYTSWCYREGTVSLKGLNKCCNCALRQDDWQGYAAEGCDSCLRCSNLHPDFVSSVVKGRARKVEQTRKLLAGLKAAESKVAKEPSALWGNCHIHRRPKEISAKQASALKVKVFCFDECLFRTPVRPPWWPFRSYLPMIESVCPPHVPRKPDDSWWNQELVQEIHTAMMDKSCWTVLVTFRIDAFANRIKEMLAYQGIRFDEIRCRPVCSVCSPLGATHTGAAGYRGLKGNVMNCPESPQDKHMTVVIADVMETCAMATDLQVWTSSYSINPQILKTAGNLSVEICPVRGVTPHRGGTPTEADLAKIMEWSPPEVTQQGKVVRPPLKAPPAVTQQGKVVRPPLKAQPKKPRRASRSTAPHAVPNKQGARPQATAPGKGLARASTHDPWEPEAYLGAGARPMRRSNRGIHTTWLPSNKMEGLLKGSHLRGIQASDYIDEDDQDFLYEEDYWEVEACDEETQEECGQEEDGGRAQLCLEEVAAQAGGEEEDEEEMEADHLLLSYAMEQSLLEVQPQLDSWQDHQAQPLHPSVTCTTENSSTPSHNPEEQSDVGSWCDAVELESVSSCRWERGEEEEEQGFEEGSIMSEWDSVSCISDFDVLSLGDEDPPLLVAASPHQSEPHHQSAQPPAENLQTAPSSTSGGYLGALLKAVTGQTLESEVSVGQLSSRHPEAQPIRNHVGSRALCKQMLSTIAEGAAVTKADDQDLRNLRACGVGSGGHEDYDTESLFGGVRGLKGRKTRACRPPGTKGRNRH